MNYLLDTCVIAEVIRPAPALVVGQWLDARDETNLLLSVVTLGELQKGISKLADGDKTRRLQTWIAQDLAERFAGRILGSDSEIVGTWGCLQGEAERQRQPLPVIDTLLAATATAHNRPL